MLCDDEIGGVIPGAHDVEEGFQCRLTGGH